MSILQEVITGSLAYSDNDSLQGEFLNPYELTKHKKKASKRKTKALARKEKQGFGKEKGGAGKYIFPG